MQNVIQDLTATIAHSLNMITQLTEEAFTDKPSPEKWSKKEIIGHLVDSAHSNLRRFVVGQYAPDTKIIYDQNFWNTVNDYQHMNTGDLLRLWSLMNERVATVLAAMPHDIYENTIDTGRDSFSPKTLLWLAEDYVAHMQHHINQIFPGTYSAIHS